jgi:hypothetical protein
MSSVTWNSLQGAKAYHKSIHELLKRYHDIQDVTDEELIKELERLKSYFASQITDLKNELGYE